MKRIDGLNPKLNAFITVLVDQAFEQAEDAKVEIKAVETIRNLGYPMSITAAPFGDPSDGISNTEADRKAIAGQAFKGIDIILLPTTATTVPAVKDAVTNPQALSLEKSIYHRTLIILLKGGSYENESRY